MICNIRYSAVKSGYSNKTCHDDNMLLLFCQVFWNTVGVELGGVTWINHLFLIVMVFKWQLWHRLTQLVLSLFNLMYIIQVYTCIIYNLCDNSTLCTWCKFALTTFLFDPLKMSLFLPSTMFLCLSLWVCCHFVFHSPWSTTDENVCWAKFSRVIICLPPPSAWIITSLSLLSKK